MPRTSTNLLLLLLLPGLLLPLTACGQNRYAADSGELLPEYYVLEEGDRPTAGDHLRYARPETGAGGLDIAVTQYVHPESGVRVALFGVVHVADAPYYEAVARQLATYDVVLYEGVKPEGLSAEAWQASFNKGEGEVASLQRKLAGWFGFQYQLDAIDYTLESFIHADMTEEEFIEGGGGVMLPGRGKQLQEEAVGETEDEAPVAPGDDASDDASDDAAQGADYGMGDRSLTSAVSGTLQAVEKLAESAFGTPGLFRSMAREMFAKTMGTADIGSALDMFPGLSELILEKRNEVVVRKLKEVLETDAASIAIFYGAAHMPDLEQRLGTLDFERTEGVWLRAWALRPAVRR